MPNLYLEHKFTIGKVKVYQEVESGKYFIKIGKGKIRRLIRKNKKDNKNKKS